MAKLIYSAITSLDGYVADEHGAFGWAEPDAEVHAFINELERGVGTYLYGRRMYDVMAAWESLDADADEPPHIRDFARIWKAADKIVYSTTLRTATTDRTRIEHGFDPEAVRLMKERLSHDLGIGGPSLASQAIHAGLVDEYQIFVAPVVVGGGKRFLPDGVRSGLRLLQERAFGNGMVYLRYRARS